MRRFSRYDARLLALRAWGAENRRLSRTHYRHASTFSMHIARIHAHIPALSGPASPFTPPFTATTTTCANLNFRAHACALGDCRGSCPALGTPNINTQLQGSPELWSTPACGGAATSRRGRTNPGQRVHPRTHSHVTLQSTAVNRFYSGCRPSSKPKTHHGGVRTPSLE